MANILDSVRLSGVTYTLAASGGTGGSGVTSGQVETMIRNYTYDKLTIDRKIDNAFDPDEYYTKADIDTKESDLNVRIDELSGKTLTVSGKVSTLEDDVENAYQEIKNVKLELSGAIDTKQDILVAGDNIIITGNVISAVMSGGSGVTSGQVQMMIDQSISGISGNTNVISGDVKTLSGDVKTISGNVVTISGDVKGLETKIDALSGKVDDKQDKLVSGVNIKTINNQSLLGSGNITISGGSGSTYTAGRGINISGDVISFDLPISAGTGSRSIIENAPTNEASGAESHAEGVRSKAVGEYSHAEGWETRASGKGSHAEGFLTTAYGKYSHAEGHSNYAGNDSEHASGRYNQYLMAVTTFGNSGNTLFTVGNGGDSYTSHNALDIRQDGSIYIPDIKANGEYYEKPMMLLQDVLSGKTNNTQFTAHTANTTVHITSSDRTRWNNKANASDVYLKTETYSQTEIDTKIENKFWCGTEAQWSQISGSTETGTLYLIY